MIGVLVVVVILFEVNYGLGYENSRWSIFRKCACWMRALVQFLGEVKSLSRNVYLKDLPSTTPEVSNYIHSLSNTVLLLNTTWHVQKV